jgi:hypothetical protein
MKKYYFAEAIRRTVSNAVIRCASIDRVWILELFRNPDADYIFLDLDTISLKTTLVLNFIEKQECFQKCPVVIIEPQPCTGKRKYRKETYLYLSKSLEFPSFCDALQNVLGREKVIE